MLPMPDTPPGGSRASCTDVRRRPYSLIFARILAIISNLSYRIEPNNTHSESLKSEYSSSPTLIGLPPYYIPSSAYAIPNALTPSSPRQHTCGINTLSPVATPIGNLFPFLSIAPGPTASTFAWFSSFCALSGRKMPPAVFTSAFTRCTRTRSRSGARDLMERRAEA